MPGRGRRVRRFFAGVVLACFAAPAVSAAPFVASTRVDAQDTGASISVAFNCKVAYIEQFPAAQGDQLRIQLDASTICNGVPPSAAQSRMRLRPANADAARLVDLEYDGDDPSGPALVLNFSEPVSFQVVDTGTLSFDLEISVSFDATAGATAGAPGKTVEHRAVVREAPVEDPFVINLLSLRRIPTVADARGVAVPTGKHLFFTETEIDGATWYRLRFGDFDTANEANAMLAALATDFPEAWIDQRTEGDTDVEMTSAEVPMEALPPAPDGEAVDKVDELMAEARAAMIAGESGRAIQIYTKILQLPPHPRQPEAQEYLAVAREKQGQFAHAKAEYQRYLSLYPDSEGAPRVQQRLNAMLAGNRSTPGNVAAGSSNVLVEGASPQQTGLLSDWRIQTFFSQYYRRDVNQPNEEDEIISQSALYSDINLDARRRGERFDISARVTAGYRNDFLPADEGSGNDTRVSYAYADVADAQTGLRARLGRQSRNSGGVLGRFDGFTLGYQVAERYLLNAVIGKPAYSASAGVDSERTFYGTSLTYGPVLDGLEVGVYFLQQTIAGINDRQALGAEFRYFGENQSVWGMVDYDTNFAELGNAFLQASWRFGSRLSLHASLDQRRSPFLSTGNAIIGQPVEDFDALTVIFTEDELRQIALDRSPLSRSYSVGVSHSLTPNLQVNADYNHTTIDASPDSGGVLGMPGSQYDYLSTTLVASSLFKEGDVMILGARYSDSGTAQVTSLTLDGRVPFGRSLWINPRLRVDQRERLGAADPEYIYTPGFRVQYRWGRKVRIELEAGRQFTQSDTELVNFGRDSYFINLGYQAFF